MSNVEIIPNQKEWEKQIWFWRTHIDVFIEDVLSTEDNKIRLMPFQNVIARECGVCRISSIAESRGLGKTWLSSYVMIALSMLYTENKILVLSKNVTQAILACSNIRDFMISNPNIMREIVDCSIQKDKARIVFKNGSVITAMALSRDGSSVRGQRAKVVFLDESILIPTDIIESAIMPILNYQRPLWWQLKDKGFEDFPSMLIETTSAYSKGVDFYQRFKNTFLDIKNGATDKFICAISCDTGVRLGMIDENKLNDDREKLGNDVFMMEYGCVFLGNTQGSFFPYSLVSKCRVLEKVELYQPKNSTARYIIILDVATSSADESDNAALSVIKFTPTPKGTFIKQLVYLSTYKGKSLGELAHAIREMCIRFPSTEKVIIDTMAIGEGIISLLQTPYVDPETEKEYPPFVCDDVDIKGTLPIIREYRATNEKNNRGALAVKVFLENESLQLPVASADLRGKQMKHAGEILIEELAVYANTDALLVEMGRIKPIILANGLKYDTTSRLFHKDRYSSLMMGCHYIYELEEENKQQLLQEKDGSCLSVLLKWQ